MAGSDILDTGTFGSVLATLNDGETYAYNASFPILVRVDASGTMLPANITFYDQAGIDPTSTPDAQSTFPLLAAACIPLLALRRYMEKSAV